MTPKLTEAVEAVERLPQARQDELADLLLEAAMRARIDDRLAESDALYAKEGGIPAKAFFDQLEKEYGD